ncbi:MAG: hypothetical protein M3285_02485 [Actinomycetota bacterium]|nr:hypothetical protein [Actinomycetota bacterium]
MNNGGSKLREVMARHLDELQPGTSIEQIRQRARRGRLIMATSMAALVAVTAASGAFVLDRFSDESSDHFVGPGPATQEGLIAFTTQDRNDPSPWVAVVPISDGDVTRLHEGRDPAWSPDGTRIAFGCDRGICTMNTDGSNVRQLTYPREPAFDESPDWGANGWIAFTRSYMDNPRLASARPRDIVLVAEDGGQQVTITTHASDDLDPTWSPDARSIAYIRAEGGPSEAPPGGWHLWKMDADGGDAEMLSDIDGPGRPDWSPDGETILVDRAAALWTIPASGGEPGKLPVVSGQAFDVGSFATWAPDSRRIAFMCSSTGTDNNDICLSEVDSQEWSALVATDENEASPAWQPITPVEGPTPSPATTQTHDQETADEYPLVAEERSTRVYSPSGGSFGVGARRTPRI